MPNSKQIVYLSQVQYQDLITNGSITVDGVTVQYDENDIYVTPQAEPVTDVRINGTSIAANGVANIPLASNTSYGVIKVQPYNGLRQNTSGFLETAEAEAAEIKQGTPHFKPIVPCRQHNAIFYGLAKASGDTTQSQSANEVGTYTPEAKGAIQQMLGVSDLIATAENDLVASKAYKVGEVFTANGKLYKATAAIAANAAIIPEVEGEEIAGANCVETSVGEGFVKFTDYATTNTAGTIKVDGSWLGHLTNADGKLYHTPPADNLIKGGNDGYHALSPLNQHKATFYGLAKAAGADEKDSTLPVGQYTDNAKASIKAMLGIQDGSTGTIDVSGTTPTITAVENTRYVCGEVTSLDFTPAASGICIVRFTSGSSVTVLTLPSTVKFPEWFDPTSLETNTIYEICVTDGVYGAVMSWAQ